MRFGIVFVLASILFAGGARAQSVPPDADPIQPPLAEATPVLEAVLVSGEQPGPGLWRVSKDEHVLWILGTLSPLPKRMRWQSDEVAALIAGSQQVLAQGHATIRADVGFFGQLMLLPAALRARNNPDGATLAQVLPAELYQRWTALKRKYLGRDRGVEKRRPILAADKLYEEALDEAGLSDTDPVWPAVKKIAKKRKVEIAAPAVELTIDNPKETLKAFARTALDDTGCFALTLERVETDLPAMQARANAWAIGDLERLRELPHPDQDSACTSAVLENGLARQLGLTDLPARIRAAWLEAADAALAGNASTFAVLPIEELLDPEGILAELRARGYAVEEP